MPEYQITDSQTGEVLTVIGDVPPSQEDSAAIFASRQPKAAPKSDPMFEQSIPTSGEERAARDMLLATSAGLRTGGDDMQRTSIGAVLDSPFQYFGDIIRSTLADQAANVTENPLRTVAESANPVMAAIGAFRPPETEFSGNIPIALQGKQINQGEQLPIDKFLAGTAKDYPVTTTVAKGGLGLAATAPMFAIPFGLAGKVGQRLISLGFTTDMLHGANEASKSLAAELDKPEDQINWDVVTSNIANLGTAAAFAPMAGAHAVSGAPKSLGGIPSRRAPVEATPPPIPETSKPTGEPNATQKMPKQEVRQSQRQQVNEGGLPAETVSGNRPEPSGNVPQEKASVEIKEQDWSNIERPHRQGVIEGLKYGPDKVAEIEALKQSAYLEMEAAVESGNDPLFKKSFGKATYLEGMLEGSKKEGPNFEAFKSEESQNKPAGVTQPASQKPVPADAVSSTTPAATDVAKANIGTTLENVKTPPPIPQKGETLEDVYKRFEPKPKEPITIGSVKGAIGKSIESFRTGLSSSFRPLDKLAEDIASTYGTKSKKGIAGIFEQLKGSTGKGEADIYRMDSELGPLVKGSEKDFNAYMFLRRSLDRLRMDAADIATVEAGGNVKTLNRRSVSDYTIPQLESKLALLESKLGPEKTAKLAQAAEVYQKHLDAALQLQVQSGRMTKELYDAIKKGNQFYAPFKVMKYLELSAQPEGTGKRVDTPADYTKAMEGIEDANFRLGDMVAAARQNILVSRILAEKNMAMRRVAELAKVDVDKKFVSKLKDRESIPIGKEAVNIFENGVQNRYAVDPNVAQALNIYGQAAGGIISQALSKASIPFRAGATVFNIPFQVSNILADIPRQTLVSKYGARAVSDLIRLPLEYIESFYSGMNANMLGFKNKLFLDFLDSGAAGSTVQEGLTPKALQFKELEGIGKSKALAKSVLNSLSDFSTAIEQTSKIVGVKRAMRIEGASSGKELAAKIPEAITEIRRFSGSPDFGRQGKWVEQARLNLLYMFLNARIQGTTADIGRLVGRDGAKTSAGTWAKLITSVGVPTTLLYMLNNSKEYGDDYAKRPLQEKQNYWLIPKDSFITTESGEKIRDYWRIPKRESMKWIANLTESGMQFAEKEDPQSFARFAQTMMEEISPVNIQGKSFQERAESVGASLNPLIKAPIEMATGRDMYRHRNIVPDVQKNASPEMQYTDRTPELFKQLAVAMPDVAPEVIRSPLMLENITKNVTAGLITQFLPRKPVEGRSAAENNRFLARFQALPFADDEEFKSDIKKLERESADEYLAKHRAAMDFLRENKGRDDNVLAEALVNKFQDDPKVLKHTVEMWMAEKRGLDSKDRQLLSLPTRQRAAFILDKIQGLNESQKNALLDEYAEKRIYTLAVAQEMNKLTANQ